MHLFFSKGQVPFLDAFLVSGQQCSELLAGIQTPGNTSCEPNTDPGPSPPLLLIPGPCHENRHTDTYFWVLVPAVEWWQCPWIEQMLNLNSMCQSPQESQWHNWWALGLAKSRSRIGVYRDSGVRSPQLLHVLSFAYQSCLGGEWGRMRENVEVCITTGLVLVSGLGFLSGNINSVVR